MQEKQTERVTLPDLNNRTIYIVVCYNCSIKKPLTDVKIIYVNENENYLCQNCYNLYKDFH